MVAANLPVAAVTAAGSNLYVQQPEIAGWVTTDATELCPYATLTPLTTQQQQQQHQPPPPPSSAQSQQQTQSGKEPVRMKLHHIDAFCTAGGASPAATAVFHRAIDDQFVGSFQTVPVRTASLCVIKLGSNT